MSTTTLRIDPPQPCVTEGCPNLAGVATAASIVEIDRDGRISPPVVSPHVLMIWPLCQECTARLHDAYERGEAHG